MFIYIRIPVFFIFFIKKRRRKSFFLWNVVEEMENEQYRIAFRQLTLIMLKE